MTESTIVRKNLMTEPNYTPYCGSDNCHKGMPRTKWNESESQFKCACGWVSQFPQDFIDRYKIKWNK